MSPHTQPVDILVYIALREEFGVAIEMLGGAIRPQELENVALTSFSTTIRSPSLGRDFQVAVVPAGKMGNTRSASVASAIIEKFNPKDVVVLGIAGSLTEDLEPGDVFIPDRVIEYLANSATTGDQNTWTFEISGNHFGTSSRLLNRFQVFEYQHKTHYTKWREDAIALRATLIDVPLQAVLRSAGLVFRGECQLHAGDDRTLASGPAVGKGEAFIAWLTKEVDRKVAAMEMESAGVYDAATIRTPPPRTIAIRGISDYADQRKRTIEASAKSRFRELAVKNAMALLLRSIEAGLFGSATEPHLDILCASAEAADPLPSRYSPTLNWPKVVVHDVGTTLIWISPGEFTMGSPIDEQLRRNDENQVAVTLSKGFWLGKHLVTQSEWQALMGTTPWQGESFVQVGAHNPATYVSWEDAMNFCSKLTSRERAAGRLPSGWQYRLPSEAQWEYACRAGTKSRFSFGDDDSSLTDYGWFRKNTTDVAEQYPHRVGMKNPNPWGLFDMHGNVCEWCLDWYAPALVGGINPQGPTHGTDRMYRGGNWYNEARSCRSAQRSRKEPVTRNHNAGFRLAMVPFDN